MSTVKSILEKKGSFVAFVSTNCSVLEATKEMNERHIGALVVQDGERVVGIFTERDILARVVAEQRDPAGTKVSEVMTSPVACCLSDTTFEECKEVMTDKRVRHLPVVENNRLLGIVTSGDILAFERAGRIKTIKYLKEYIHGPYQEP